MTLRVSVEAEATAIMGAIKVGLAPEAVQTVGVSLYAEVMHPVVCHSSGHGFQVRRARILCLNSASHHKLTHAFFHQSLNQNTVNLEKQYSLARASVIRLSSWVPGCLLGLVAACATSVPPTRPATPAPAAVAAIETASVAVPTPEAAVEFALPAPPVTTPDSPAASSEIRGTIYYVSSKGNDRASGRSRERAWRTLVRASRTAFQSGDRLLLEGNSTFRGTLRIEGGSGGTAQHNILISSYGSGHATIDAACGDGMMVRNLGGVKITRLRVVGCGPEMSNGTGVKFENSLPNSSKLAYIRVDSLVITGFGRQGLLLQGTGRSGYRDVRITHVTSSRNALVGIEVMSDHYPYETEYAYEDVYIEGIPTETQARERRGAARRARGPTAAIEVLSSQYVPGDPRNEPANVRVRDNLILSSAALPPFRMDYSSSTIQHTGNRLLRP
jgi:hypothetical protein